MGKGKINYFAVIGTAIITLAMLSVSGCANKTPKIEIIPDSYDFGNVPYEKIKHTFLVRNAGAAPLEIKGVSTSCGCTKATVESETIMPGETTNLLVTFDPNIMGDNETGEILRVIYIKSNDPGQPEVEVEIKANVKK